MRLAILETPHWSMFKGACKNFRLWSFILVLFPTLFRRSQILIVFHLSMWMWTFTRPPLNVVNGFGPG